GPLTSRTVGVQRAVAPNPRLGVPPDAQPRALQTGGSTHPGGSITGAPGRNAATVLLSDLGHDPAEVMGARRTSSVRTQDF
ncbi:MAG: hypothetical protein ACRDOH_30580, partial [Streptosporangiaceae bacterium]